MTQGLSLADQLAKFQGNALRERYDIAFNLVASFDDRGADRGRLQGRMAIMTIVEPRTRVPREPRRQLPKKPAWMTVDNGMTKRKCFVLDVSPGGARIASDDAMDVGDKFELALVPDHPKRELCEVVWRRAKTYGVKFLT